nr:SbcC/MukB-like Walker B domain-containing protein [Pseudomonas akapageensis]
MILGNWGQIEPGDYQLGDMTLLTGGSGAGKSTFLDALQMLMTAGYKGILHFNPAQGEVTQDQRQKTKRNLESYVVGAEYSKFSRPDGAQTYVGAVFMPDRGEVDGKPFTALVAASARVDAVGNNRIPVLERSEVLIILDGVRLSVTELFKDGSQQEWVPVEEVVRMLKAKGYNAIHFPGKRDYLCALYGRFRGKNSVIWDDARAAAKAWVESIAYKKIGSVNDLVKDEILAFDGKALQEGIERISGLMKQVTNLRKESERLQATHDRLASLTGKITGTITGHETVLKHEIALRHLNLLSLDADLESHRSEVEVQQATILEYEAQLAGLDDQKSEINRQLVGFGTKLMGYEVHQEKQSLETLATQATKTAVHCISTLLQGVDQARRLSAAADDVLGRHIPLEMAGIFQAMEAVSAAHRAIELDQLQLINNQLKSLAAQPDLDVDVLREAASKCTNIQADWDRLHATLVGTDESSLLLRCHTAQSPVSETISQLNDELRDKQSARERMVTGGGNYPKWVSVALDRMREAIPSANVQVLCDLIEPASERWQSAIEGYLADARFNFVVPTEFERDAIDTAQRLGLKTKVIQGDYCQQHADLSRVPAESIIHELTTEHRIAKAYLIEQYGRVVKVSSSEELRHTPRGLTMDGKGSGSRTMFSAKDVELVFGRKAREAAIERLSAEIMGLEQRLSTVRRHQIDLQEIINAVQRLQKPLLELQPLQDAATRLESVQKALARLDLTEIESIEAEIAKLNTDLGAVESTTKKLVGAAAVSRRNIDDWNGTISSLEERRPELLQSLTRQIDRVKGLCDVNRAHVVNLFLESSYEVATKWKGRESELKSEIPGMLTKTSLKAGDVRHELAEHNRVARQDERFTSGVPDVLEQDQFDTVYGHLVLLRSEVLAMIADLKNIGLLNNAQDLADAEASFRDVFTKQFCVEIRGKVEDGVRELRILNHELRNLKFGSDRFEIEWSKWVPEFYEYYTFFGAVAEMAASNEAHDLFGSASLTDNQIAVRDRLIGLLLDDDHERATKELMRIADYRNYRVYDIVNHSDSGGTIKLSEWGTGSGGQLETPAYIVRAAVVTNKLKVFEKGPSLKLLVNDESFARMDETRARAVLGFLRDNLNLQVICAVPTMKAGAIRDEFTREYTFTRLSPVQNGELDFISECDSRELRPDKMQTMWEQQRMFAREQARMSFDVENPPEPNEEPAQEDVE